jgi:hypothetical protein
LGNGEKSASELVAQMSNYALKEKPYDFEFVQNIHTVKSWWHMCRQKKNHIQKLALLMASIIPHNADCERYFSILGWYVDKRRTRYIYYLLFIIIILFNCLININKKFFLNFSLNNLLLQNMLQMHAYYISNITNEIKYAYKDLSDEEFEDMVTKTTFPFEDEIFDNDNDDDDNDELEFEEEQEQEAIHFLEPQNLDSFFNFTDIELRQALEVEVTVEIPCSSNSLEQIDDGDQNFNIESILDKTLKK